MGNRIWTNKPIETHPYAIEPLEVKSHPSWGHARPNQAQNGLDLGLPDINESTKESELSKALAPFRSIDEALPAS